MAVRGLLLIVALTGALLSPVAAGAETALESEVPAWAPVATATIRPGVQMNDGGCTSNFIFYEPHVDPGGGPATFDIFVGVAAHCFSLGASNQTNGCTTPSEELGTRATIDGATYPATLVYSSWLTMQDIDEAASDICAVNDFALLRLDPRDHAKVNPTVLHFGGPTGIRTTATSPGDELYTYGNSGLRFGLRSVSPKWGYSTGITNGGWSHRAYTVSPGIPGDSGSGMLDGTGRAMGVLVTLQAAPFPASNGVTDVNLAWAYMRSTTATDTRLALGTEPFTPNRVPPPP